jgi:hypothetical protein
LAGENVTVKKEQWEIFKVLTDEIGTELCFFCKFVEYNGCGECCECVHPLIEKMLGLRDLLEPGEDCWLFKNRLKVEDCADIVGIALANNFDEWAYRIQDDGTIKVYGRSLSPVSEG